jgi:hypothetical protein
MDVSIIIPNPTVSSAVFSVVIKNAAGTVVYTGTESNTAFTVTGLSGGNYTMTVTNGGYSNEWCFTVSACSCPNYVGSVFSSPTAGLLYFSVKFDMSEGFPACPFVVAIIDSDGTVRSFTISSLSDLTLVSGSIYELTSFVVGPNITLQIQMDGMVCVAPVEFHYLCTPPLMPDEVVLLRNMDGSHSLQLTFPAAGVSCTNMTINWLQDMFLSPDAGSTIVNLTGSLIYPNVVTIPVDPTILVEGAEITYTVTVTDCCGATATFTVSSF